MEQTPPLQPHELAQQLADGAYEVVNGRVESERLGDLIRRAESVWRELRDGEFEKDEHGHVTFEVTDSTSDYTRSAGDHVDSLNLVFNDPTGRRIPLGSVSRLDPYDNKATATVRTRDGKREPLLPHDLRWNAVVGTVERAVAECWTEKFGDPRTGERPQPSV